MVAVIVPVPLVCATKVQVLVPWPERSEMLLLQLHDTVAPVRRFIEYEPPLAQRVEGPEIWKAAAKTAA